MYQFASIKNIFIGRNIIWTPPSDGNRSSNYRILQNSIQRFTRQTSGKTTWKRYSDRWVWPYKPIEVIVANKRQ